MSAEVDAVNILQYAGKAQVAYPTSRRPLLHIICAMNLQNHFECRAISRLSLSGPQSVWLSRFVLLVGSRPSSARWGWPCSVSISSSRDLSAVRAPKNSSCPSAGGSGLDSCAVHHIPVTQLGCMRLQRQGEFFCQSHLEHKHVDSLKWDRLHHPTAIKTLRFRERVSF